MAVRKNQSGLIVAVCLALAASIGTGWWAASRNRAHLADNITAPDNTIAESPQAAAPPAEPAPAPSPSAVPPNTPPQPQPRAQANNTPRRQPRARGPANDPVSVGREALVFVGADAEAEAVWSQTINDSTVAPRDRQNLIEDLNEVGFADPRNLTQDDLPLIEARIALIERMGPDAVDQTNSSAFQEAYKDLKSMRARLTGR